MPNARTVAMQALLRVERDQAYSNLVWNAALQKHSLSPRDTAFAGALFYGVLERQITLDYVIGRYSKVKLQKMDPTVRMALRMGVYQLLYMDGVPASAAIHQSVESVKTGHTARFSGFVNGVLRAVQRAGETALSTDGLSELTALSVTYAVPEWLCRHYIAACGKPRAEALMASFFGRRPLYLRVNTQKTDGPALAALLAEEGITAAPTDLPEVLSITDSGDLTRTSAYEQGLFHVQDLSSAYACRALEVQPGQRVLDLCAAPGGKTFTLAQQMEDRGELISCDLYEHKVELIRSGARRLGLTCIHPLQNDAAKPDPRLGQFDRILCDLPCSGLGILGRKPEIRYKNDTFLDILPDMQYGMLCNAVTCLKPGGRMVFSTCTLNPEENTRNLERLLAAFPELSPRPVLPELARVCGEPAHYIHLFPDVHGGDGFFVCAVGKDG